MQDWFSIYDLSKGTDMPELNIDGLNPLGPAWSAGFASEIL